MWGWAGRSGARHEGVRVEVAGVVLEGGVVDRDPWNDRPMQRPGRLLATALLLVTACRGGSWSGDACERAELETAAAELWRAEAAWTPEGGTIPDPTPVSARALWKGCPSLPVGLRAYVDVMTEHPTPPWERDGRPMPEHAVDEFDAILPGHAAVHGKVVMEDPATAAIMEALCPGAPAIAEALGELPGHERSAALFDRCDLGRHGLLSRDEVIALEGQFPVIFAYAIARWLQEEGGASPEVAHVLARALAMSSRFLPVVPRSGQRLAVGTAAVEPLHRPNEITIHVGPDTIEIAERKLVDLDGGAAPDHAITSGLIGPLDDALAEEGNQLRQLAPEQALRLAIIGDRSLDGPTLATIVSTARKAGFAVIDAVIVIPDGPRKLGRVPLSRGEQAIVAAITVSLDRSATRIACGDAEPRELAAGETLRAAIDGCAAGPGGTLRLSAGPGVALQRVIDAAIAARDAGVEVYFAATDPG